MHLPGVAAAALRLDAAVTDTIRNAASPVPASGDDDDDDEAANGKKCPNCENDCEQTVDCLICHEPCCPDCAPDGICDGCRQKDEEQSARTPRGVLQPLHPAPAAAAVASRQAGVVIPLPAAAVPAAAPAVPTFSASEEIAKLEALIPLTICGKERFRVQAHLEDLESGRTTQPFLSQSAIDERQIVLYQEQSRAKTAEEKLRIGAQIDQLSRGIDPGPFVPGHMIDGRVAALEASLQGETDSAVIWDTLAHIAAIKAGQPFVPLAERRARRADLEAKLEVATNNTEIFNLAREINAI